MIETAYKVGIYIRLSREDEDKDKKESESISNQRSFILDYLKENNYIIYDEYVDDGYSGTSFDRPAFKRMIADIEAGKINMVITKDLSRLGRDYIQTGEYLEKYFPEHNIRYIAISDCIDTTIDCVNNDIIPFKAVFNDMYAKDISKKIKASLSTRKKNGLFLGTYAPYGYIKDPDNNHKLLIDPVASIIVKRIYRMYLEGNGLVKIARIFTKEGIPRPSDYGEIKVKNGVKNKNIWSDTTIKQILKNPTYTGNLYQNKRKKVNYKLKKIVKVSPEHWLISYNTHEPIIDQKTFNKVQSLFEKSKLVHKGNDKGRLLKGFMFCKECGHTIGVNESGDKKRNYTICNYYRKYPKYNFCTIHSMRYEELEEIVLSNIRKMCKESINTKRLENIMKNNSEKKKLLEDINSRTFQAQKIIENNTHNIHLSYMDRLNGIITIEMYQDIADKLSNEISINQRLIAELKTEQQKLTTNKIRNDKEYKSIIQEFLSLEQPNRCMLASIIDKITIDKNRSIEIYYKIKQYK